MTHSVTLPNGTPAIEECRQWFIPYYAVVVMGVISFQTSCHIVEEIVA